MKDEIIYNKDGSWHTQEYHDKCKAYEKAMIDSVIIDILKSRGEGKPPTR